MASKAALGPTLRVRVSRHVGLGFNVKPPKWSDDLPTRGTPQRLGIARTSMGGGESIVITLNDTLIIDMNLSDARQLGLDLIVLSDR